MFALKNRKLKIVSGTSLKTRGATRIDVLSTSA